MIYPIYNGDYDAPTQFAAANPRVLYRAMNLENQLLPPGTYYMQYIVYDMFMRPIPMDWIKIQWTGDEMKLPEGFIWEGAQELTIPEAYWR